MPKLTEAKLDEMLAMKSGEIDALRKDAERYRWLRNDKGSASAAINQEGPLGGWERVLRISGEYLDALIDTEIANQSAVGAAYRCR